MKKIIFAFGITLLVISCENTNETSTTQKGNIHDTAAMAARPLDSLTKYTAAMLDSEKDLVCGMPVSAGIADTAHYKGKTYGFCSNECKDELVKNPAGYIVEK